MHGHTLIHTSMHTHTHTHMQAHTHVHIYALALTQEQVEMGEAERRQGGARVTSEGSLA